MEPLPNTTYASGGSLNAFAGAQGVHINDLRFTQAQNVYNYNHSYHYNRPIDLSQLLNPLPDASHTRNRMTAPPDSQCLAGTRRGVFQQLDSWMQYGTFIQEPTLPQGGSQVAKSICWMYGSFGCGKSAIAQSMAEWYAGRGRLAASFFFFRGAGRRSTTDGFVTTLSHQIAMSVPGARRFVEQAIAQDPHVAHSSRSLESRLRSLVYLPLLQAVAERRVPCDDPYLIIIDGMDECEDKQGITSFIDHSIVFFSSQPAVPLRLFITSRVEEHIRTHIEDGTTVIHLFDLSSRSNSADVEYAMQVTFANARKYNRAVQSLGHTWPPLGDLNALVKYCDGSFIFMSTIAKFILWGSGDDDPRTPVDRLQLALKINPGIDGVYRDVLSRARHLPHFLTIVSTVAHLRDPLSISATAALLGFSTYEVIRVLVTLQAILQVPGRDDEPVTFFHTSLRDFLTDEGRSSDFHSPPSHHTFLMHRCLDVLVGTEPTANVECCKYALKYYGTHRTIGAGSDPLYSRPLQKSDLSYMPVDHSEWMKRNFHSRRGEGRPIKFAFPVSRRGVITLRTENHILVLPAVEEIYTRYSLDPTRWLCQCDEARQHITLKSLHVSSLDDLTKGLEVLVSYHGTRDRYDLELEMRRGNRVSMVITLKWARPSPHHFETQITIEDRVDTD